jgi:FKBP-type peptidyl-prolyl cis-trans isomerase
MLRSIATVAALTTATLAAAGCSKKSDEPGSNAAAVDVPVSAARAAGAPAIKRKVDQVAPPSGIDIKNPPADAEHGPDGLIFKSLAEGTGPAPKKNDTVVINYTGWHQNGETFYSSKTRGRPVPMALSNLPVGFVEAMGKVKKGGRAIFWLPPAIGYKNPPKDQAAETLAFEVELVDLKAAPPIPPDVGAPPADAKKTARGVAFTIVKPGTGTAKARPFDTVSFQYTAWDATGRMFDSTESRGAPRTGLPLKEMPGLEDALTQLTVGARGRFWIPPTMVKGSLNAPAGTLCYEVELVDLKPAAKAPPPVPADVAAPPKDAKKTASGISYKVIAPAKGSEHPKATDMVKVNYTGWTTDGRLFDSSYLKGQPAQFSLGGVIKGWTEGVQLMVPGETMRFWIPVELAYNHQPGKPDGMLVFDIELIEVVKGGGPPPGHP